MNPEWKAGSTRCCNIRQKIQLGQCGLGWTMWASEGENPDRAQGRTHPISSLKVRSLPLQLCLLEPCWHAMEVPYPSWRSTSMTLVHHPTCHLPKNALFHSHKSHCSKSKPLTKLSPLQLQWVSCRYPSSMRKKLQNITLWQVLYCPDLSFTLVLLLWCNMAGYSVLLKDGKCIISNLKGIVDGQIPLTGGLYNHIYTPGASESANVAHTTQTLHELHWDMDTYHHM